MTTRPGPWWSPGCLHCSSMQTQAVLPSMLPCMCTFNVAPLQAVARAQCNAPASRQPGSRPTGAGTRHRAVRVVVWPGHRSCTLERRVPQAGMCPLSVTSSHVACTDGVGVGSSGRLGGRCCACRHVPQRALGGVQHPPRPSTLAPCCAARATAAAGACTPRAARAGHADRAGAGSGAAAARVDVACTRPTSALLCVAASHGRRDAARAPRRAAPRNRCRAGLCGGFPQSARLVADAACRAKQGSNVGC